MGETWSDEEVALTVSDYLDMLTEEVHGRTFSKTEHRSALIPKLQGRGKGAVEFKYGNVSAALRDLGYPFVDGYKPYSNYQHSVLPEVEAQLRARPELVAMIARDVSQPASIATFDDILAALVAQPEARESEKAPANRKAWYERTTSPPSTNFLEIEARNRSLGDAGEKFAFAYEQARLVAAGSERLASAVEHVSRTRGDGLGFDILSFEATGAERLIEVKTTRYGKHTPFFISRNEVRASETYAGQFSLYRLFQFREEPKLFILPGAVRGSCRLEPVAYEGRVK